MTRVAVAADVQVSEDARATVETIVIVADPRLIIDPDGVVAQLEGGAVQAVSWALKEQVRWDRSRILSRDWDSYPIIRFDEVPNIIVKLMNSSDTQSVRVRRMPFDAGLSGTRRQRYDSTTDTGKLQRIGLAEKLSLI